MIESRNVVSHIGSNKRLRRSRVERRRQYGIALVVGNRNASSNSRLIRAWVSLTSFWDVEVSGLVLIFRLALVCAGSLALVLSENSIFAQATPQTSAANARTSSSESGSAEISGTVLDANGDVVEGAVVALTKPGVSETLLQTQSGATGQFVFADLRPGKYIVTVSGKDFTTFVSQPIRLESASAVIVPNIVLGVAAATTSVTVMDEQSASIQQVEIAEQQRVFKVFPNFYSSFDWNAPPMLAKQKYRLAARTLIDPVTFLTTGAIAGAEQYKNVFPSFGGGVDGYAKRYGAAYASHASGELLTRAVFPSMFHTDPRYFIMGKGTTRARAMHAISSTFVTRGDNATRRVNFPEILGSFSAAALSNAYFPANERGANLVLINGFGNLGGDMLDNVLREFVFNRLTTRAKH